jgi:IS5 family transposase
MGEEERDEFFGYKDHIKTDAGTSLITDYRVTTASMHDSVVLKELVSESDGGKPLHADSAYTGEEIEQILKDLNIENKVCEKGRRGAPLTEAQHRHNRQKSKNPCYGRARVRVHGKLNERHLPSLYRNQKSNMSDRIGQPDL